MYSQPVSSNHGRLEEFQPTLFWTSKTHYLHNKNLVSTRRRQSYSNDSKRRHWAQTSWSVRRNLYVCGFLAITEVNIIRSYHNNSQIYKKRLPYRTVRLQNANTGRIYSNTFLAHDNKLDQGKKKLLLFLSRHDKQTNYY